MDSVATQKTCSRCRQPFTCRADEIEVCSCRILTLAPATLTFLAQASYTDCLCPDCLHLLDTLVRQAAIEKTLPPPSQLKEGIHYYREGGAFVFTAYYLVLRGYCCQNGCRHCPYGYRESQGG